MNWLLHACQQAAWPAAARLPAGYCIPVQPHSRSHELTIDSQHSPHRLHSSEVHLSLAAPADQHSPAPPGSATSVAKASSQALDDAASASAQAVADATGKACGGGDVQAEASALAQAVATATAKAFADTSAQVNVQGGWIGWAGRTGGAACCPTGAWPGD